MVKKLANLLFLLFSIASPKPLFLNNSSSKDIEPKLNPLPIKPELPIFMIAGMGPALPLMDIEVNPTLVISLVTIVLLIGLLLLLLLFLPKDLAGCVNQCGLPIQCNANFSKRAYYEEI